MTKLSHPTVIAIILFSVATGVCWLLAVTLNLNGYGLIAGVALWQGCYANARRLSDELRSDAMPF